MRALKDIADACRSEAKSKGEIHRFIQPGFIKYYKKIILLVRGITLLIMIKRMQ
jgi:hypothetical protein